MGAYDISTVEGTDPTCFVVPTAHHEVDHFLPVQRIFVFHDTKGGQAPVYSVHTQMGREVVHQVIFVLQGQRKTVSLAT